MFNSSKYVALSLLTLTSLNAGAALTGYTANGANLVYSGVADITWTEDANLLATMARDQGAFTLFDAIIAASPTITDTPNDYDTPAFSGVHQVTRSDFSTGALGSTSWFGALAFVNYLNSIHYAGSNQWMLPEANVACGTSINCVNSTMGSLYYSELGFVGGQNPPTSDSFSNDGVPHYWLSTERPGHPIDSYRFSWHMSNGGNQSEGISKGLSSFVRPYSPGMITAVPVPPTAWLFGSGLLGLFGWQRRV
ncbi:hypothetical protein A1507_04965 [Methylomonas koyamae]|uniref:Ice-binding protein C-terminal domain-containing protein n=1 Tax=Methylomonas koyamae TaxID=702114 RepID=A0A177NRB5_9GAMM|nr:hypothetical protein [Methylomonas koyamae]OAI20586.1 hypothetical protein A1507_04965 [Methylomonas koyamae]